MNKIESIFRTHSYKSMVNYANALIEQGITMPKNGNIFAFTLAHLILNTPPTITSEEEEKLIDSLLGEKAQKRYNLGNSLKRISNLKNALR